MNRRQDSPGTKSHRLPSEVALMSRSGKASTFVCALWPRPILVSWFERLRGAFGGGLGGGFTAFASLTFANMLHLSPWLVAPVGASAVLVFAVPASPLAQPWAVVGGNTVAALMGLVTCNLISDPILGPAAAVGLAIAAMFALRCQHPPGGAMALLVVLTQTRAPLFALFPAFTNSLLLVLAGLVLQLRNFTFSIMTFCGSGLMLSSPE